MNVKKKIGLFFGSFNPIHIGHTALANFVLNNSDLDQIWFVVSPHNPLKEKKTLLKDHHRYALVERAIAESKLFKASKVEFNLPRPSYTIDTLVYLSEKYPDVLFVLILGADSLKTLNKWKNYQQILEQFQLYVYPRPGFGCDDYKDYASIKWIEAPLIEISSSMIRSAIEAEKSVEFFMHKDAFEYLNEMNFYKK